ncbi:hypothetical protein B484DRAFT_473361, partial [Ochromonadaceae sp. CCMP2298]
MQDEELVEGYRAHKECPIHEHLRRPAQRREALVSAEDHGVHTLVAVLMLQETTTRVCLKEGPAVRHNQRRELVARGYRGNPRRADARSSGCEMNLRWEVLDEGGVVNLQQRHSPAVVAVQVHHHRRVFPKAPVHLVLVVVYDDRGLVPLANVCVAVYGDERCVVAVVVLGTDGAATTLAVPVRASPVAPLLVVDEHALVGCQAVELMILHQHNRAVRGMLEARQERERGIGNFASGKHLVGDKK